MKKSTNLVRASSRPRLLRTMLLMGAACLLAIYILAPFYWLVVTTFMHEKDALSVPPEWLPSRPTLENYLTFFNPSGVRALVGSQAAKDTIPAIGNSLIVATSTAILNVVLGSFAGYSFARLKFRGRGALLMFYLASRMVPGIALIIPLYLTMRALGLLDTLPALILTYLTFTLPFTVWLLKNYFQGIPRAVEEAAMIDGCSWWQMLFKVLLPMAKPGLAGAGMFAFMTAWNDYLFAVILTNTMASKTVTVVVAGFATDVTTARTLMTTGGVLAVIPPLVLAFLFRNFVVQSLTAGAVKG